ncbi:hypothetical protein RE428_08290 [Marinobacter nanhaiticus D15-8W]|uniref:DUF4382 domain-containing protein n=1 Tax=Marinobacter nanhaiticus D15-8W TaxID=626887 RepID=N6W368_9GAMM|nr:DUF4382 domain-containing protein [Marinobacter nanhaiticus]ENO14549.1 DUF4382 domain-containing protein [Marinobacter nanhaiticus D15-8W]BES69811.1 hypothetical protein RE428_08290 [Marinobacter nanhaiticus D15-8W]
MKHTLIRGFTVAALAAAVSACGGGGSGSSDGATGSVSLNITDAPTDAFTEVVITFTGVTLKPNDGEAITIEFDEPKTLDLLTLQGGESAPLLEDVEVAAGDYAWIRLTLDESNLYVMNESGGMETLAVPSGAQTGLKLVSGFTVAAGGESDFTIDFDVRKSIVNPQGNGVAADYFLKPALRLVNNLEVGSITGTVDYATINQSDTCDYEGMTYIYLGADVEPTDLNLNSDGGPLMAVPVSDDENPGTYTYKAAFLSEGDYTVSYSCQLDDNETDNALTFIGTQNVAVVAGEESTADIDAPAP